MKRPINKNNQGSTYSPFRIPSEGVDQKKDPTHESHDHGTSKAQKAAADAAAAPADAAAPEELARTLRPRIL